MEPDSALSLKLSLPFCCPFFLFLSGFLNVFQIELDQRGHLGGLPVCLFGFLRPGKREMPDLPWFFGLFEDFKGFQKDSSLTFPVSGLPHGSPVRVFNGGRSGDTYRPVKIVGGCEDNG